MKYFVSSRYALTMFASVLLLAGCGSGGGGSASGSADLPNAGSANLRTVITILNKGVPQRFFAHCDPQNTLSAPCGQVWLYQEASDGSFKLVKKENNNAKGQVVISNLPSNGKFQIKFTVGDKTFVLRWIWPTHGTVPPPFPAKLTCNPSLSTGPNCKK